MPMNARFSSAVASRLHSTIW